MSQTVLTRLPWQRRSSAAFVIGVAIALLSLAGDSVRAQRTETGFRAAVASRDITPREPVPMWGYGDRHDALSNGTLDPLQAVALVIQAGGTRLAIVGLDLGRSPAEASLQKIRKRIREAGIEHSFIAGSHTHHGPVLELTNEPGKGKGRFDAAIRYYGQLEEAISSAILEAGSRLAPARLAVAAVQLQGFNRNRHAKLQPRLSDRELAILRLDDPDGKPLAVLANFSAHPTMIPASTLKFSADFVGSMKRTVEKAIGAPVLFMQGSAGDQSVNEGASKGYEAYGERLGREVIKLASGARTEEVTRPDLQVHEETFQFAARTDFTNPIIKAAYSRAFFPELIPNYVDEYAEGIRPRMTLALLNRDIALVGVSGEFFASHALRLKERAQVKQLFFFGYCNGYHQYFPTIEAVAEGGYGADNAVSPVAIGAGERMMDAALIRMYQMLGKLNDPSRSSR